LRIVINEIQQHAWIVFIFFLFFSQIKELELKLKQQEHDRSAVELNVTPIKICYLWLCYMKLYYQYFYLFCQIKELEHRLKEQEHERSVAELKVTP